jgi:hypothetical protein
VEPTPNIQRSICLYVLCRPCPNIHFPPLLCLPVLLVDRLQSSRFSVPPLVMLYVRLLSAAVSHRYISFKRGSSESTESSSAVEFWELCRRRDEFRKEYMKYWNSTRDKTESKRPVDGVILPVAPSAAVEEGLFSYFGQFSSRRPMFPRVLTISGELQLILPLQICSITLPAVFPSHSPVVLWT